MPTIKSLRDTLNFGDALIRKLCAFKDVSIKGDLFSPKFRQHFKADGAVCSLKQDAEGNFNFKIDGVSHVSWFRRKQDEFMEALGLRSKETLRKNYINPAIELGVIRMTLPDKPNSKNQRYVKQ